MGQQKSQGFILLPATDFFVHPEQNCSTREHSDLISLQPTAARTGNDIWRIERCFGGLRLFQRDFQTLAGENTASNG